MHEKKLNDCAILIPSCDAYSDTWQPFFHFFSRAWPDCLFDIYLGTNFLDFDHPKVNVIKVGKDLSWAEGIRKMLQATGRKHILLCLEDYFFYELDPRGILSAYSAFRELKANYLQLVDMPPPNYKVPGYPSIGEIKRNALFKAAIGFGYWDVTTLLSLLRDGESAWDMEERGSVRARELDGFYRCWKAPARFHNAIVCGKWQRAAIDYCRKKGVSVDTAKRGMYTRGETVRIAIKSWVRRTLEKLPDPLYLKLFAAFRGIMQLLNRMHIRF